MTIDLSAATPRRSFLTTLVAAISAVLGALMAIPLLRFATSPLFRGGSGKADWFSLGRVDAFAAPTPTQAEVTVRKEDGWRVTEARQTVWVTHNSSGSLLVLSAVCPHLGCIVPWEAAQERFVCPCHGGQFAKDGERLSGPPPRGLDRLPIKVDDGILSVRYEYFRQGTPDSEVVG